MPINTVTTKLGTAVGRRPAPFGFPTARTGGGFKVIGVEEAIAKFGMVGRVARIEVGYLVRVAAEEMEKIAKSLVPVITGNLKSGIKTGKVGPYDWGVTASSREGEISPKNEKEYAAYVEFGTSKMEPRPYMLPAYHEVYPQVVEGLRMIAARLERL